MLYVPDIYSTPLPSVYRLVGLQKTVEPILSKCMKRSLPIVSIIENNFKRSMYILWEGAGGFKSQKAVINQRRFSNPMDVRQSDIFVQ